MIHSMFVHDVYEDFRDDEDERDGAIIGWISLVNCFVNRGDICTKPVRWERECS